MSRLEQRLARKRQEAQNTEQHSLWQDLCRRIDTGQVIPIISNALFLDRIFDVDNDQVVDLNVGKENPNGWSIEEQLANIWAEEIRFPLGEQHRLAHVALFDRVVNSSDDQQAKRRYLDWLKDLLLFQAEDDPDVTPDQIEELRDELEKYSFADIVVGLGYPKPLKSQRDPLELLAILPFPIYVTTSPFDFLERALRAREREPRTQVCFWSAGKPVAYTEENRETDHDFVPTIKNPLVYHIFGLEAYPESIVLNEDDHLDFLARISQDTDSQKPLVPVNLRGALAQSSLILLGYRLRDWDFRIVFRGLIKPSGLRKFNLSVQLDPDKQGMMASVDQVRDYLVKYFGSSKFNVEWGSSYGFIERLWEAWHQRR